MHGVYLDPVLNWKDHIFHVSKKIGSRLALLSRMKRLLPFTTVKLLANAMVLPLFDYCSIAWSNCAKNTKDVLVRQHKRMAKIVMGVNTRTPTEHVLNQLNWTSIEDRWRLLRCKMVYRTLNGQAPDYLSQLFNKTNNVHNYRTRAAVSEGLIVPKARTNMGKMCFSHSGAVEWNKLPCVVRHASSKQMFTSNFWKASK